MKQRVQEATRQGQQGHLKAPRKILNAQYRLLVVSCYSMQDGDMLITDDQGRVCTQVARFWSKTNTNDGRRMEMESKLVTISRIWDPAGEYLL